jgi:hypothetical protein
MGLFDFLRRAFTSTKDLENNKPSGKILNKRQKRDIIGLSDEEI